ncbi:hypothetical protein QBC47DRAFT_411022 [Echria macrotheca]|uniref:Copper acquisition factor BIM1-like domain-containing protein n=1 Tax=Echria macrotheca TaxID=438768 RepID=A0AAJ0BJF1_9PEZI|nr:hypothetical protein QBC47DRAFT_411022 [Echria macrotheca]
MATTQSIAAALLLLTAGAQAHFTLNYPPSIGFDDAKEGTGPCGGVTPDFSKNEFTDFHVGGDNVGTRTSHPQGNWLYRVTLDPGASANWTQVYPIVQQSGIGDFCAPLVRIPDEFVGKQGILSVVGSGGHGFLYQCAALNFVEGTAELQSACKNASGVTSSFVTDASLAALVGSSTGGNDTAGDADHSDHQDGDHAATKPNGSSSVSALANVSILLGVVMATGIFTLLS